METSEFSFGKRAAGCILAVEDGNRCAIWQPIRNFKIRCHFSRSKGSSVHHIRLQKAKWRGCGGCLSVGTINFAVPNPSHHFIPRAGTYIVNDRHCTNTSFTARITCILHRSYWILSVLTISQTLSTQHSYLIHDFSCTMTNLQVCSWCVMTEILKMFSAFKLFY